MSAGTSSRPSVAVNTAYTGLNIVIRLGVNFALLPLLLHGIGKDRTGLFLFATTLTGYFTAVDTSVNSSVTRYVSEHRAREEHADVAATVRSALVVLTGFGLLAAAILVVLAVTASTSIFSHHDVRGIAEGTILAAAGTSALYWPSRVGVAALNGLERYDRSAQIQIATSGVLLVGLGLLAHEHASVVLLTLLYGGVTVLEGLLSAALAWRPLGISRAWLKGKWLAGERLRDVAKFGAAAFVVGIGDTLVNGFDRAIVGAIVGAGAIVAYDTAQRPQQAVRVIAGLSGQALVSPVARLAAHGEERRLKELVLNTTFLGVVLTAPLAVLVIVLAHPFIGAWLGASYLHYAVYLQIFTSFWIPMCCTVAISMALYGIGKLDHYARIIIVMSVASLPLSVALAYAWGTVGVIWGTVIPSIVVVPFLIENSLRLLKIPLVEFGGELVQSYGVVLVWAAVVVAAKLALQPSGYAGIIAFGVPALLACWGGSMPIVRRRLAAARREAAADL